jgi:hypothetical protein
MRQEGKKSINSQQWSNVANLRFPTRFTQHNIGVGCTIPSFLMRQSFREDSSSYNAISLTSQPFQFFPTPNLISSCSENFMENFNWDWLPIDLDRQHSTLFLEQQLSHHHLGRPPSVCWSLGLIWDDLPRQWEHPHGFIVAQSRKCAACHEYHPRLRKCNTVTTVTKNYATEYL